MADAYGKSAGADGGVLMRDRLIRRVGEVLSVGFVLVVVGLVAWILSAQVDFELLETVFPRFVEAFWLVVRIVAVSSVLSVTLGVLVGLGRISNSPLTSRVTKGYVEFFRGTPLLFQLFLIFIGVPSLWATGEFPIQNWSLPAAVIGLTLNHAAYVGEAIRGGIDAVPDGQMEAARSLGMSRVMALREVVLPQAWRNALAAIGNDQVILVKDTSLLSVLAVPEIISTVQNINSATFDIWTPILWAAILYLAITIPLGKFVRYLEARADPAGEGA